MEKVEREIVLGAVREEVWSALTDPERLGEWLGEALALELRPGGELVLRLPDGVERHGFVEEVDPPAALVLWWRELGEDGEEGELTRVELRLGPDRGRHAAAGVGDAAAGAPRRPRDRAAGATPRAGWRRRGGARARGARRLMAQRPTGFVRGPQPAPPAPPARGHASPASDPSGAVFDALADPTRRRLRRRARRARRGVGDRARP